MPSTDTAHQFLRRETEPLHRAVEDAFAPYDLTSRDGYSAFLLAQAAAVFALEHEVERHDLAALMTDWPLRRRGGALREDLATLGLTPPPAIEAVALPTSGQQLGALYVLEGSRLGGTLLAREASRSDDDLVRSATAFLRHQPGPNGWATFRQMLDRADVKRADLRAGAQTAFTCFLDAATRHQTFPILSLRYRN